jgi:8-amino-7-oxononanoate synthase
LLCCYRKRLLYGRRYGANLIVDEAHAVGLYSTGIVTQLGLQNRVFARTVTFGKALGCHCAIILGSKLLRQYLINFARSFIYTTAAPFHQLASIKMACGLLVQSTAEMEQVKLSANSPYSLINSDSPIQCVLLKSNEKATEIAAHLQKKGFDVRAILSPTVPLGGERVRICLHAYNTANEVSLLAEEIYKLTNGK